ncbi:conserved hypothetical protein [Ricinus communis]|uniref:RNase H type-1 domain-containing protein n=1 Tax=Ricinus communis TaxID=3988 RepID=B9RPR6_RICCO|nr:conserved hypothetical protein [Ricinus communis]
MELTTNNQGCYWNSLVSSVWKSSKVGKRVQGDSKMVIGMVNGLHTTAQDLAAILDDIVALKAFFTSCYFFFIPRTRNWVADSLAKKTLNCSSPVMRSDSQMIWLRELSVIQPSSFE